MRYTKARTFVGLMAITVTLTGCKYADPNRKPFQPPAGTAAAVYIDNDGNVIAADAADGSGFTPCSAPGSKSGAPTCRGLSKGAEVQSIKNVTVIRSKINPICYTVYNEATGALKEKCIPGT